MLIANTVTSCGVFLYAVWWSFFLTTPATETVPFAVSANRPNGCTDLTGLFLFILFLDT